MPPRKRTGPTTNTMCRWRTASAARFASRNIHVADRLYPIATQAVMIETDPSQLNLGPLENVQS
jgi:hypothetical protein